MSLARALWFALVFLTLVVLHYTLRPMLGWHASIDFLAIAVLLVPCAPARASPPWSASPWDSCPTR